MMSRTIQQALDLVSVSVRTHPSQGAVLCLAEPGLCQREKLVWALEIAWGSARYHTSVQCTWPVPITTHCLLLVTCTSVHPLYNSTQCVNLKHLLLLLEEFHLLCKTPLKTYFIQYLYRDLSNNFISRSNTFINKSYNRISDKINIFYDQF